MWSRVGKGLDHRGAARRVQSGKQHRGLHLRRRHGKVVDDGEQIRGAAHRREAAWHAPRRRRYRGPSRQAAASTRPMGRRRKRSVARKSRHCMSWPAMTPSISRLPVPELPKSSGADGRTQAADALPVTSRRCRSSVRPRRRAPLPPAPWPARLRRRAARDAGVPVASAPRISARWEIDLSPGTVTRPERRAEGLAVKGCFIGDSGAVLRALNSF